MMKFRIKMIFTIHLIDYIYIYYFLDLHDNYRDKHYTSDTLY